MRYAIVASAGGNGKTTLGRALAARLDVPFVELDALVHGPNWAETPNDKLRAMLAPIVAGPAWVIDGGYEHKIGELVTGAADRIVWLDLPIRVWLPRLVGRTVGRLVRREELWNGNRESISTAFAGWDSLVVYALRSHVKHRREWPERFAGRPVVRLRSAAQVTQFLNAATPRDAPV